ncbi:MAG TPA: hypothetical protein VF576_04855 [Rubricoccaceae bacterium]
MRLLTLASLVALVHVSPAAAQTTAARIAALPPSQDFQDDDGWSAAVRLELLASADSDRSGAIDAAAEVDVLSCADWQAVQGSYGGEIGIVFGFDPIFAWNGGALGFTETVAGQAFERLTYCLNGPGAVASAPQASPRPAAVTLDVSPSRGATPGVAGPSLYDTVLAVPGDPYDDAWASGVQAVLLGRFDADASGQIDTDAEVDAVSCGAWEGMQDAVRGGVREIYGFDPTYGWVGSTLGFDEALRERAHENATFCLPGARVADEIAAEAGGGSLEWKERVARVLVSMYDADGSERLDAREARAIQCDVWRAVERGYAQGEYDEFWVGYGFAPGMIWNASEMGFDESAREAAYADMASCRYLIGDTAPAVALGQAPTSFVANSQQLDGALDATDTTLRTGEYVETWHLYAEAGQSITGEVYSSAFDPYVILKSPSGQQFENDDWAGSTSVARVDVQNAEEGTWEVLATSYLPGATGAYEVTVSSHTPSAGAAPSPSVGDLVGTVWAEVCSGPMPARTFLRLEPDGQFAWSETSAADLTLDSGETWSLNGPVLTVSWNDGFATTRYVLDGTNALAGVSTKTCGSEARLVRIGG